MFGFGKSKNTKNEKLTKAIRGIESGFSKDTATEFVRIGLDTYEVTKKRFYINPTH